MLTNRMEKSKMAKDKLQEGARKHLDLVVELTQT